LERREREMEKCLASLKQILWHLSNCIEAPTIQISILHRDW
jgi:hypothetical protein